MGFLFSGMALDFHSPKKQYERLLELLEKEKQLSQALGELEAWQTFKRGISEQYQELLKWRPQNTITIHDPELPGVVIVDSVNS